MSDLAAQAAILLDSLRELEFLPCTLSSTNFTACFVAPDVLYRVSVSTCTYLTFKVSFTMDISSHLNILTTFYWQRRRSPENALKMIHDTRLIQYQKSMTFF